MDEATDGGAVIDRLFAALRDGDLAAARDCLAPDARVWHGFDRIAQDPDGILADWATLVRSFPERGVEDVRRQATQGGYVQQHVFVVRRADGARMAWPVCIVVRTQGGKISRLDEYIDRTGAYTPEDGPVTTPGF